MEIILIVTAIFSFFTGGTAQSSKCVARASKSAIDWTFINEQYESMFGWNGDFDTEHIVPNTRNKTATLIFGDSIDRMIVGDLCDRVKGTIKEWGEGVFQYKEGQHASGACTFDRGVIAFLHVFGSPLKVRWVLYTFLVLALCLFFLLYRSFIFIHHET